MSEVGHNIVLCQLKRFCITHVRDCTQIKRTMKYTCKTSIVHHLLLNFCFVHFPCRWPQTVGWLLGTTVTLYTRFYPTRFEDCLHFLYRIDHPVLFWRVINRVSSKFSAGNWLSQAAKLFWTELFHKKSFPLYGQTRQEKSSSQPVNLPGAWAVMKPIDICLYPINY